LWAIDLASGEVKSKSYLREDGAALGNLAMYRGMLLSLTPAGLTAFEQREAFAARIRERKARDPRDPWALLREADTHLLNREYAEALTKLREIRPDDLTAESRPEYRERMVESLAAVLRGDLKAHDAEMQELAGMIATDPAQRLLYERLQAERLRARQEYQQAFEQYLKLAGAGQTAIVPGDAAVSEAGRVGHGDAMIARGDDPTVTLRLDRWLAGELRSLWDEMPEDARREAQTRIHVLFEAAAGSVNASGPDARSGREKAQVAAGRGDLLRFATLFGFHPRAVAARRLLVEDYARRGEFVRAENLLLRLSRHPDPKVAAAALERLARLLVEFDLQAGAARHYARLEALYPDVHLDLGVESQGTTVREHLAALREAGQWPVGDKRQTDFWGEFDLAIDRRGTGNSSSSNQVHEVSAGLSEVPYFKHKRLLYLQGESRLAVVDAADDALAWLAPLRRNARSSQGNAVASEITGHHLIALHGDVIHSLSPVERRILWTRPIAIRSSSAGYYRPPSREAVQQMQVGTSVISGFSLTRQRAAQGMLAVANAEYVCTYGRREFTVYDATTGAVLWKKTGVPLGTQVYGTDEHVFVVPRGNYSETAVLRALDGQRVDMPDAGELLGRAIRLSPQGFVVVEAASSQSLLGLSNRNTLVRLVNPADGKERWKVEFPNNTSFALLDEAWLTALRSSGELELLNLETGETRKLGSVDPRELKAKTSLYTIADHERVYLVINERRQGNRYYYGDNMPSLEVNGTITAFDRQSGQRLWSQQVLGKRLVHAELTHSPILVFSSRMYESGNMFGMWNTSLLALDKRTGRKLAEDESASNYSGFQWMTLNMSERYVELRSYNMLVRLKAVERSAESRAAADAAEDAPVEAMKPVQPTSAEAAEPAAGAERAG
ncbi:MAG TPA: PQQ-binding-like beta-propeller repeat protein, partial [Planctomycetaceae bacterium]|nr:PQQ-binding-like beta-propeller repeat protein [Planctomycetaceae bacterium]